jgi:hypothetical protein
VNHRVCIDSAFLKQPFKRKKRYSNIIIIIMDQQQLLQQQQQLLQQVAHAALAMVRPHTDAHTRSLASAFLEDWTRTRESWQVYSVWLHESWSSLQQQQQQQHAAAASTANASSEAVGMILLCLQLLQGKIRREITSSSMITDTNSNNISHDLECIQGELIHLLLSTSSSLATTTSAAPAIAMLARPILTSASICLAALVVRKNMNMRSNSNTTSELTHFIQQCLMAAAAAAAAQCFNPTAPTPLDTNNNNNNMLPTSVAFCLLTNIPLEVEAAAAAAAATGNQQTHALLMLELRAHVDKVLETCCCVLVVMQHQQQNVLHAQNNTEHLVSQQYYAMETLLHWTKTCRVSLAHYNTPLVATSLNNNNDTVTVLQLLLHMLSSSSSSLQQQVNNNERLLVLASNALTEAILIPDDDNDNNGTRSAAVQTMLQAIAQGGFIAAPLHQATANRWDDATHALVVLLCTFCTEEVDEWCSNDDNIDDANVHALLELLLQVQNHPNIKICCLVRRRICLQGVHNITKRPKSSRIILIRLSFRLFFCFTFYTAARISL